MATALGPGDGLQPDAVVGGGAELSHAVGGRRGAQNHLLGGAERTETKLTAVQHTPGTSGVGEGGGLRYPDHTVSGGEGEGVAGDGGLRRLPGEGGAVGLDVGGLQFPRRVHVCKRNTPRDAAGNVGQKGGGRGGRSLPVVNSVKAGLLFRASITAWTPTL